VSTWKEAREAKAARLRREHRYYTPDQRGPRCPVCKGWTDPVLREHPTCTPESS
jgi:hypothetical protein